MHSHLRSIRVAHEKGWFVKRSQASKRWRSVWWHEHRPTRIATSVAVIGGLGAMLSGCSLVAAESPTDSKKSELAVGHIHGLAVDAENGDLFIATHTGVYRLPAGGDASATLLEGPIGGNKQDTMGFTMSDGVMFGSGHPDPAGPDAELPSLGLIVSTDRGATWRPVSLAGQADFHDIVAVENGDNDAYNLFAYDGATGAVLHSSDSGATWSRGADVVARDITFDENTGTLYATLENGVAASSDDGATFVIVDAPALYLIEALNDGSGRLVGVDVDGAVWLKTPEDAWRETGAVAGMVEALTYSDGSGPLLVVADTRGVSTSLDFGASWETVIAAPKD